jgi:pimeloyl-ACP methyl ester carboxylesterase
MGQPNVEAITSLLDLCAADEACGAAYPDLRKRFEALLVQLDKQPLTRDDGTSVTAATLVGALRQSDIRPGLGAYIPLMIWELEQGKQDTLNAILNNQVPPLPPADFDPVAIRYAGLDPSPDAQLLIDSGLNLRQKARELDAMAERLLLRADEDIALQNVGSLRAGRFDLLYHEILNAQPFDRRLALNRAYLAFPLVGDGPTVEGLKAFIAEHFHGSDAKALTALADEMSEADIQALAQIIFGKARAYATFFNVSLALSLFVCQEHVPYNNVEGALKSFQALEIPEVARGKWGTVANLLATCDLFPTGLEPAGFHQPVESDIPTLILLGTADTQTAASWGEHAAESLENSQVVHFPETGHGAIRYSQCARDVGAAFLNDPEGDVNPSCTGDLIPLFVLPPQENERSASGRTR